MHITGLYAALCALLVMILAFRVVRRRQAARIVLGHGEDAELLRLMRVHANAVEYIPLALLLLLLLEINQTKPVLLHVFGIVLVAARCYHAFGLTSTPGVSRGRVIGTAVTWLLMAVMSVLLLWQTVLHW